MEEKLAIDIFIKYSTNNLNELKKAFQRTKMIIMRDLQLDDRFQPKRYVRYYLTVKVLRMPDRTPISSEFNITNERIERIHNAALTLDILEMKLQSLKDIETELYCYFEMGGIYVLGEGQEPNSESWYQI